MDDFFEDDEEFEDIDDILDERCWPFLGFLTWDDDIEWEDEEDE